MTDNAILDIPQPTEQEPKREVGKKFRDFMNTRHAGLEYKDYVGYPHSPDSRIDPDALLEVYTEQMGFGGKHDFITRNHWTPLEEGEFDEACRLQLEDTGGGVFVVSHISIQDVLREPNGSSQNTSLDLNMGPNTVRMSEHMDEDLAESMGIIAVLSHTQLCLAYKLDDSFRNMKIEDRNSGLYFGITAADLINLRNSTQPTTVEITNIDGGKVNVSGDSQGFTVQYQGGKLEIPFIRPSDEDITLALLPFNEGKEVILAAGREFEDRAFQIPNVLKACGITWDSQGSSNPAFGKQ